MAVEAHRIWLTVEDFENAINGFAPKERRDTASFLRGAILQKPDLFRDSPGKISDTEAELWITNQGLGFRHHISLNSDKNGKVRYEKVDMEGRVLQELTDRSAFRVIREVLTQVGALILIED